QYLVGGEAGEDLHAQRFGLRAEPARDRAQRDDVVAVVVEAVGQEEGRRGFRAVLVEEQELVARDRLLQRRAALGPVGKQFRQRARIHDRAREDVRAGLRTLFQHAYRRLAPHFRRQLLQADRRG